MSSHTRTADDWIGALDLRPHPEGGHYRETWRSDLVLPGSVIGRPDSAQRNAGTAIHFLLRAGESSRAHRVSSDELWVLVDGDPLILETSSSVDGPWTSTTLSHATLRVQQVVPSGVWQRARPEPGVAGWTLCICVVVPGFDFEDFELA